MADFVTARLADVAEVKGGKRLPPNTNLVATPTSHPYIRGRDIRDGKITFEDPMYVLDEDFEKIENAHEPMTFPSCEIQLISARATARFAGGYDIDPLAQARKTINPP